MQIVPSVTPLVNLNSGFRVYEVDSGVCIFIRSRIRRCLIHDVLFGVELTDFRYSRFVHVSDYRLISAATTLNYSSWAADVNAFAGLDGQTEYGPTYEFEYSAREAYGQSITQWGPNDPLNATWWHLVTEGQ